MSLKYCSEIVNSFPGTFSCHKATFSCTDHRFNFMFVSFENHLQLYLKYMAHQTKGHATRNDIVDDIVDFSSSTMAFNVAKIASSARSLTISLTKSLRVAGP